MPDGRPPWCPPRGCSQEQLLFGLRLTVPKDAKRGQTLKLDLIQRDGAGKQILGGVAVQINVR